MDHFSGRLPEGKGGPAARLFLFFRQPCLVAALALLLLAATSPAAQQAKPHGPSHAQAHAQEYETPTELSPEPYLSGTPLTGHSYRVDPAVHNDGAMNTYVIHSRYGEFTADSTALARVRILEIVAMDAIAKLDPTTEMGKGFVDGLSNAWEGAVDLVTEPVKTIKGAASGVGKMFSRARESSQSVPSKYEDDRVRAVIGLSRTKREYAAKLGVDPYTTNPILRQRLEKISSAGYVGGLGSMGLKAAIPGGVGLAVSTTSSTRWLEEVDLTLPPTDLRQANREKLTKMGVTAQATEAFIDNSEFTPTQQSLLTAALHTMPGVAERGLMVRRAARIVNQDQALAAQRTAQMYSGFHQKKEPLDRLLTLGDVVAAQTFGGRIIIAMPLDHLTWTKDNAAFFTKLAERCRPLAKAGVSLYLTGTASEMASRRLRALGLAVHENADTDLLG